MSGCLECFGGLPLRLVGLSAALAPACVAGALRLGPVAAASSAENVVVNDELR